MLFNQGESLWLPLIYLLFSLGIIDHDIHLATTLSIHFKTIRCCFFLMPKVQHHILKGMRVLITLSSLLQEQWVQIYEPANNLSGSSGSKSGTRPLETTHPQTKSFPSSERSDRLKVTHPSPLRDATAHKRHRQSI